jgi:hypothetical protein
MAGAAPPNEERVEHPFFARFYLRMASGRKSRGEDEHRRRLLEGLSGRVPPAFNAGISGVAQAQQVRFLDRSSPESTIAEHELRGAPECCFSRRRRATTVDRRAAGTVRSLRERHEAAR